MWDSIETHCWPVDKLAAIVISNGARWKTSVVVTEEDGTVHGSVAGARLSPHDAINVTRSPTKGLRDKRGLKSEHFVVIGFSRRDIFSRKKPLSMQGHPKAKSMGLGYRGNSKERGHRVMGQLRDEVLMDVRKSVWYVMDCAGSVFEINEKGGAFPARFKKLESGYKQGQLQRERAIIKSRLLLNRADLLFLDLPESSVRSLKKLCYKLDMSMEEWVQRKLDDSFRE
jgi:hypothetical protein